MDPVLIGFIVYLLAILFVGFVTFRLTRTLADYLLAGRKLGPWVVAFSERASGESAWLLIGLPGAAFASGLLDFWVVVGCVSGIIFSWLVISRRLRDLCGKLDVLTLPNMFETRFRDGSHSLRIVSSLIITFFFTFYVAAQFIGAGKVLNATFGISEITGMLIGAGIILFYTIMGGFYAVAWTDLVQGILMFCTLTILPLAGLIELGGPAAMAEKLAGLDPALMSVNGGLSGWTLAASIIGGLSWGLGYMGQPHLLARYIAIRKTEDLKKSAAIAISWAIPAFTGAFIIGLVGYGIFSSDASAMAILADDAEKIMPMLARTLLPAWLAGIFISGAIAAMMSTADSQLLVTTSAISEDIYHNLVKRDAPQVKLILLSRIATIVVGIVAFFLALSSKELVFTMVGFAWAGLGSSFGPAILLTLWWKRTTRQGVLAGMITGAVTTIIWSKTDLLSSLVTERFSSFLLALAAVVLVSLLTRMDEKALRQAD